MKDQLLEFIKQPAVSHLLTFLGGALIVWILLSFFKKLISKYVEAPESRYRFRKFINLIGYLIFALLLMMVYSNQLSGLTVFLGVAGAGIAFALQEVIASFAGFIAITTSNFYKISDQVMLGGTKGDVADYQARSGTKDKIYSRLLDAICASEGRLSIASTAMEVTNIPHEGDGIKKSPKA